MQAWDGLLSDHWIGEQCLQNESRVDESLRRGFSETNLLKREASFCSYRQLSVLCCSFNLDAAKPSDLSSNTENASFLSSVLNSVDSPDIIVFAFQEMINLDDKKLQASTYMLLLNREK